MLFATEIKTNIIKQVLEPYSSVFPVIFGYIYVTTINKPNIVIIMKI